MIFSVQTGHRYLHYHVIRTLTFSSLLELVKVLMLNGSDKRRD